MEAYLAKCANAFTDACALEAIRLVVKYLGRAIESGANDREAREYMAWANTLGGIVIGEGNSAPWPFTPWATALAVRPIRPTA